MPVGSALRPARGHSSSGAIRAVARGGPYRAAGARARRPRTGQDCAGNRAAAARVLDRLGISYIPMPVFGCCGAASHHLSARDAAPEHRRMVAGNRSRGRGGRHYSERVRGRGQRVRGAPGARSGVRGEGGARLSACAGPERGGGGRGLLRPRARTRPEPNRVPLPVHPAARAEAAWRRCRSGTGPNSWIRARREPVRADTLTARSPPSAAIVPANSCGCHRDTEFEGVRFPRNHRHFYRADRRTYRPC